MIQEGQKKLHNDAARGDILRPPHNHYTPKRQM